MNYSTDVIL